MNIPDLALKIKNLAEDALQEWGVVAIVVLVGLSSFGLGRLSASEQARPVVSVREADSAVAARAVAQIGLIGGLIVASRRGSAYHYPWCPGAAAISQENKVWFKSEEAAKRAGYTAAKNCKGLE